MFGPIICVVSVVMQYCVHKRHINLWRLSTGSWSCKLHVTTLKNALYTLLHCCIKVRSRFTWFSWSFESPCWPAESCFWKWLLHEQCFIYCIRTLLTIDNRAFWQWNFADCTLKTVSHLYFFYFINIVYLCDNFAFVILLEKSKLYCTCLLLNFPLSKNINWFYKMCKSLLPQLGCPSSHSWITFEIAACHSDEEKVG